MRKIIPSALKIVAIAIKVCFLAVILLLLFSPYTLGFTELTPTAFEALDLDGDGALTEAEILVALDGPSTGSEDKLHTLLEAFEAEGVEPIASLSLEEAQQMLPGGLFPGVTLAKLKNELLRIDAGTALFWLSFAAAIKMVGIFAGVVRWRILLRAQGVHIPFWYLTKCWFWGRAIGLFLPGTLGLDGYRLVESSRYTGEVIKCTAVVVVEKLTGIIALFSLVFLTIPLGMRLFDFNLAILAVVLIILASFISISLLLLFQPRIIQVIVAAVPTPRAIRSKVEKVGAAATAYGGHRGSLFAALFFALCVHLGICLMYFGAASALRAENTGLLEIFFASPLIIVGSVFAPTVSGAGVRELVMTTLLGATAGPEKALIFGHMGLWFGEIVPFLLSVPLLLLTGRPNRESLLEDIKKVRATAAESSADLHLSPEEVGVYKGKVYATVGAGIFGGAVAGALIGMTESAWLSTSLGGLTEYGMFTWGAFVYGILFAGVGLGVSAVLLFFYLLFDRFATWTMSFALSLGGTLAFGGLVIGLWRFQRDVLAGMSGSVMQYGKVAIVVLGISIVVMVIGYIKVAVANRILGGKPPLLVALSVVSFAMMVGAGAVLTAFTAPSATTANFAPETTSSGPNIILVAVDTLRADYLPDFDATAAPKTPAIHAFAGDSVLFENTFSQASWTKPSFGTIFTGLYPEAHTATGKTSALPDGVDTIAELLADTGYYTQGFPNNPNVSSIFKYDQGFIDYTYLRPDLFFWASDSASKLSMYEVLRKVRMRVKGKLGFLFKMNVTDYYQPAETVTDTALAWLDNNALPEGTPYFLYTHYMDPHDPFMAPDSTQGGYARSNMPNPDAAQFQGPMREAYIREIEHLDEHLARLFAGLKERGQYDDTLIVFTADHGEEFYEHQGWWHGFTLYDEQTHVPLIVKLPGNAKSGTRNDDLARHVDIAPTMLHYAGAPKGQAMTGQSLFDADNATTNASIICAYAENNFEGNVLRAVRTRGAKVINANADNISGLAEVEAYDILVDPGEQNNVAGNAVFELTLQECIDTYQAATQENAAEPAADAEVTEELQDELESLGYL